MLEIMGYGAPAILVVVNAIILARLHRQIRDYTPSPTPEPGELAELPTVSVCIPARNEAHALTSCLERVLASDYQKLEIIVLDDNSEDDTSTLIKAFAQSGVRFIAGRPLEAGWIGKNHALDTMAREASGSIILFLDVDTHIEPKTISRVVRQMLAGALDAYSVVPMRRDIWRGSTLFGHMRYFWEVLLSSDNSPLVSSGFWLIRRDVLVAKLDGFRGVSEYVQPEYPITALVQRELKYKGVISDRSLGVYFEKKWLSQLETSQRMLYLLWRRSRMSTALLYLAIIGWGSIGPMFIVGLIYSVDGVAYLLMGASALCALLAWWLYLRRVWTHGAWLGVVILPYTIVQEEILFVLSYVLYKTHRVTWKGRPLRAAPRNQAHLAIDE